MLAAYLGFSVAEMANFIAILIYAYEVGGSPALGLVAFLQLAPAACSPRWGPRLVTVTAEEVMLTVAALFAASSASVAIAPADWPVGWVYFLAAVNATVLTLVRPFHESLLPALARSTEQLTRVCRRWDHREPGLDRRSAPGRAHRDSLGDRRRLRRHDGTSPCWHDPGLSVKTRTAADQNTDQGRLR